MIQIHVLPLIWKYESSVNTRGTCECTRGWACRVGHNPGTCSEQPGLEFLSISLLVYQTNARLPDALTLKPIHRREVPHFVVRPVIKNKHGKVGVVNGCDTLPGVVEDRDVFVAHRKEYVHRWQIALGISNAEIFNEG